MSTPIKSSGFLGAAGVWLGTCAPFSCGVLGQWRKGSRRLRRALQRATSQLQCCVS